MKYIKKDLGAYQLHLIKTNDFKSSTIRIFFRLPMTKENITKQNLLNRLLVLSCEKYKTKVELSKACQECYGATISANLRRIGTYLCAGYTLKVLKDQYTEYGNFYKSLELLNAILFHPNIDEQGFKEQEFNSLYEEYKTNLEAIEEDKGKYAMIRLMESLNKDAPYAIRGMGYLEELEKLTREKVYEYYKDMIKHSLVDIFVLGDIEEKEIIDQIKKNMELDTYKAIRQDIFTSRLAPRKRRKIIKETTFGAQTSLAIALTIEDLDNYERNYPLILYNIMLGGGSDSLLFTEVREKKSLAYHIHSTVNKLDHLILIHAGIDKEKEEECFQIIKKQWKKLKDGAFSEDLLEHAKEYFISAVEEVTESTYQIIEAYYMMELVGVDDLETKKKKIKEVTREEIIEVAQTIAFHTTYFLEGEE